MSLLIRKPLKSIEYNKINIAIKFPIPRDGDIELIAKHNELDTILFFVNHINYYSYFYPIKTIVIKK